MDSHTADVAATRRGTAVVTGASAGIGAVYADRLAARGYDLLLVARRRDRLEAIQTRLAASHGVAVSTVVADLADPAQLEALAIRVAAEPSLTLLVNNAGTSTLGPVGQVTHGAAAAMNGVNVDALVRLCYAVLPGLRERGHGTIVNIGSVLGFSAIPGSAVYSATKAYVTMFTRALQDELAGTGVRVQLVAPAATATDLWDIAGVPLLALDPAVVMQTETMVDAALAGLDVGEAVTMPSLDDQASLLAAYDAASLALLSAARTGVPARRYTIGTAA